MPSLCCLVLRFNVDPCTVTSLSRCMTRSLLKSRDEQSGGGANNIELSSNTKRLFCFHAPSAALLSGSSLLRYSRTFVISYFLASSWLIRQIRKCPCYLQYFPRRESVPCQVMSQATLKKIDLQAQTTYMDLSFWTLGLILSLSKLPILDGDLFRTDRNTHSIVAVHGLDGHHENTWTADNGVLWLKTLLSEDLPKARVYTYGYDSRTHSRDYISMETFYGHARNLLGALTLERRYTKVLYPRQNSYTTLRNSIVDRTTPNHFHRT